MKYTIDVWYPYGSTHTSSNLKEYLPDLPNDLTSKIQVEEALQNLWNSNVEDWFNYDDLEITTSIAISDEEYQEYIRSKNDPFDVWAKAVRESRANKLSHQ